MLFVTVVQLSEGVNGTGTLEVVPVSQDLNGDSADLSPFDGESVMRQFGEFRLRNEETLEAIIPLEPFTIEVAVR